MEPYIRRPRPVEGRAEEPSCRSWFNHPIRVLTANSSKDTRACLNGLMGCEDTIDGQDGRMTGLMWAGWPQPRCGWVFLWVRTQGRPRSSANPGLRASTPLALVGLWERATRTSPPRSWDWDGKAMSSTPWGGALGDGDEDVATLFELGAVSRCAMEEAGKRETI